MNLAALKTHVAYHRSTYLYLPGAILLLWLIVLLVHALTGRPLVDSPDSLVGDVLDFFHAVLAIVLTKWTQSGHIFKRLDTDNYSYPWWQVLLDYLGKAFCLVLYLRVFHVL